MSQKIESHEACYEATPWTPYFGFALRPDGRVPDGQLLGWRLFKSLLIRRLSVDTTEFRFGPQNRLESVCVNARTRQPIPKGSTQYPTRPMEQYDVILSELAAYGLSGMPQFGPDAVSQGQKSTSESVLTRLLPFLKQSPDEPTSRTIQAKDSFRNLSEWVEDRINEGTLLPLLQAAYDRIERTSRGA